MKKRWPRPPRNRKLKATSHNAPSPECKPWPKFSIGQQPIVPVKLTATGILTKPPSYTGPIFAEVSGLPSKLTVKSAILLPVFGAPSLSSKPIIPPYNHKVVATSHNAPAPDCTPWPKFATTQITSFTIRSLTMMPQIGKPSLARSLQ